MTGLNEGRNLLRGMRGSTGSSQGTVMLYLQYTSSPVSTGTVVRRASQDDCQPKPYLFLLTMFRLHFDVIYYTVLFFSLSVIIRQGAFGLCRRRSTVVCVKQSTSIQSTLYSSIAIVVVTESE
jgi:hypothetical protein